MTEPASPTACAVTRARDYEELWQHAPSGYLLVDDDGTVAAVNATFTAWTGHQPGQLVGTPFDRLLPVGDRILWSTHCMPQLRGTGRVSEASVQVVGADGQRRPALLSATRVETGDSLPEVESEARIAEAETALKALVHRDALTGVLNRPRSAPGPARPARRPRVRCRQRGRGRSGADAAVRRPRRLQDRQRRPRARQR